MHKSPLFISLLIVLVVSVIGFQCSSTEITSAKLYIQQKNLDKAMESLQKEVTKNPNSDEGYYLLGYVYGEKEKYKDAMEAFNKSLSISNKYAKNIGESRKFFWANLFNKGVAFYQKGINTTNVDSSKMYFEKSIVNFENAVEIEPDSADTYKNLAFVYMSAGDNDKAISPLKKLIELEKALDGYRYLGEIYYTKGSLARNDYEVTKNPQDSINSVNHYLDAIKVLEEGRKSYPSDSELLVVLSNSYIGANKIDVAIDAFKTGVEQEPENKYYRYNYGVLLLGSENYEEAEKQFKKAIEIDPEYSNAVYNLAVTYVRWGTALNKLAEEKQIQSDEYKEKYRLALPYLEKVAQSKEADAGTWELLGKVYTILGMQDDANNAFQKADELRK
jgi:tetratricopeptide (TPR) repeat protein